jgi:hypothetical protein
MVRRRPPSAQSSASGSVTCSAVPCGTPAPRTAYAPRTISC